MVFDSSPVADSPVRVIRSAEKRCQLFKLNIDCLDEVFEFLSLDDLISIAQSCKPLQRATAQFFQRNFAAKRKTCENDGIYMCWPPRNITIFSQYIEKVSIFGRFSSPYNFIGLNCTRQLKEIRMGEIDLTHYEIDCIKKFLSQSEVVGLDQCYMRHDFYAFFLKLCPNLRILSVSRSSFDRDRGGIIGSDNEWLLQTYPKLELLELNDLYELKMNELNIFFANNPNVRTFSTDVKSLMRNRNSLLQSSAQLDTLAIEYHHPYNLDSELDPIHIAEVVYNLLLELQRHQFFKHLHLYITFLDHHNLLQKLYALDSLQMLAGYVTRIERPMLSIRELAINKGLNITDMHTFPAKLPNLERIYFSDVTSDQILPFVSSSPKLTQMKIDSLLDGIHLVNGVLDLRALNNARGKLTKVRKLTIFVNERIYLATKWMLLDLNFKLIELKRGESFEWDEFNTRHKHFRSF